MMRVLKFGGAALRDGEAVQRAAGIVATRGGDRPLVVVSAHEGVTALLERAVDEALHGKLEWDHLRIRHRTLLRQLDLPGDLLDRHLLELRAMLEEIQGKGEENHRLRDFVLSFGERMSARVFAAVLRRDGLAATPLDAYDLGLVTEGGLLEAPDSMRNPVGSSLRSVPGIPVVTGFLAQDGAGFLTTLGPNGSDLTAVWFAEAVDAEEVQLWKSVPGVMTADPKLVPGARRIPSLGWDEAAALAQHGSEIVHPGALETARRSGLAVRVLYVESPSDPGTLIEGAGGASGPLGIAHRKSAALLRRPLDPGRGRGPQLAELFERLAANRIEPHAAYVSGRELTVLLPDEPEAARLLGRDGAGRLERDLSTVAVVGRRIEKDAALERTVERLRAKGIRLSDAPLPPSPRSRLLLTTRSALSRVVVDLHRTLFETLHPAEPQSPASTG